MDVNIIKPELRNGWLYLQVKLFLWQRITEIPKNSKEIKMQAQLNIMIVKPARSVKSYYGLLWQSKLKEH